MQANPPTLPWKLQSSHFVRPSFRNAADCSDHAGKYHVFLKLPVFVHRLDSPIEFLPQGLGKELFDWHVEFLGEDDSEAGIDVILQAWVSQNSSSE